MKIGSPLPRRKARIEIIPLIDIMFFLLASFMLASLGMLRLQSVRMALPDAKTAQRDFKAGLVNISIGKGDEIYIEKTQITLVELHGFLANKLRGNTNIPVYVSADKDAKHGYVKQVLNALHGEGVQKVSFAISAAATAPPK
jgi:biopolymer transport protein ExbD